MGWTLCHKDVQNGEAQTIPVPRAGAAEEFARTLSEDDLQHGHQPVHKLMGAHVDRMKRILRRRRQETEERSENNPTPQRATPMTRLLSTIMYVAVAVAQAGNQFGKSIAAQPPRLPRDGGADLARLRELSRQRRPGPLFGAARGDLQKCIPPSTSGEKMRRLPQARKCDAGVGPIRKAVRTPSHDTTHTHTILWTCCTTLKRSHTQVPQWINQSWSEKVLDGNQHLNQLWVRKALQSISKNKTSAEDRGIVEMLLGLDEDTY